MILLTCLILLYVALGVASIYESVIKGVTIYFWVFVVTSTIAGIACWALYFGV